MKRILVAVVMVWGLVVATQIPAVISPTPVYAACDDKTPVFGITKWYRGLVDANCQVQIPDQNNVAKFITMLILNIIQAGFGIAAYVTVFFLIKGGFNYMTSTGSPEGMSSAKKMIRNAVIGLIIVLLSSAIVNTIAGII